MREMTEANQARTDAVAAINAVLNDEQRRPSSGCNSVIGLVPAGHSPADWRRFPAGQVLPAHPATARPDGRPEGKSSEAAKGRRVTAQAFRAGQELDGETVAVDSPATS
jgi:hypothetical protein